MNTNGSKTKILMIISSKTSRYLTKSQVTWLIVNDMVNLMDLDVARGHFYEWPLISTQILSASVITAY